jgi:hypothetical protein
VKQGRPPGVPTSLSSPGWRYPKGLCLLCFSVLPAPQNLRTNLGDIRDKRGKSASAKGRRPRSTSKQRRKSRLSRWRSGLHSGFINFCRALGLNLLSALLAANGAEDAKVAVHKSRSTSVLRALVHLIPIGGAVALIVLNCHQLYLGPYLKNISLLQFAAKLHELTMLASLAAVLLTYIRYELTLGVGLPFGALFSGLQITQISYLWSLEFWGSISSTKIPIRRRLCFLVVTLITISLAATVGPASALAMIPRLENWPAGRTHIWLNGSNEDIWPSFINASDIPASCSIVDSLAPINSCPSSRWRTLVDLSQFGNEIVSGQPGSNWVFTTNDTLFLNKQVDIEIRNNNSYSTVDMCGGLANPGPFCLNYMVTMPHATISDALATIEQLWDNAILDDTNRISDSGARSISHSTQALQPFTQVQCLNDIVVGVNDTTPIYFPNIFNVFGLPSLPQNFSFSGFTKPELINIVRNTSEQNLIFVDLVGPGFSNATTGAILLSPSDSELEWFINACYISSGWGISNITGSGNSNFASFVTKGSDFSTPPYEEQVSSSFTWAYSFNDFPLKPIRVTSEWASYLNPLIVGLNTTVMNLLCTVEVCNLETDLALMITNGLALTGGSRGLEGDISWASLGQIDGSKWLRGEDIFVVDPAKSKHWVKLEVNTQVLGLVYATQGLPIKLAIAILAVYIAVAFAHFIYACVSGFSSTSWGSISEVTALAMNSPPSEDLQGTCAGIEKIGIFRIPVRILAARGNAGVAETEAVPQDVPKKEEHLELVFGDVDRKVTARHRITVNKKYGTLKTE